MANPVVHMELATTDLAKAKEFYGELFGWKFDDQMMGPGMIYSLFVPDSGPRGGAYSMPGMPPGWLAYVGVEDIDESTEKAKSLGATILTGVTEVTGMGWLSIIIDPTGACVGLWQAKM